jgi:hypothetical protein
MISSQLGTLARLEPRRAGFFFGSGAGSAGASACSPGWGELADAAVPIAVPLVGGGPAAGRAGASAVGC